MREEPAYDKGGGIELARDDEGLYLAANGMRLRADFKHLLPRVKPGALQRELLVRAAKTKRPSGDGEATAPLTAIDATAGLGEDSFLLAAAGFSVTMHENDPAIAALLRDALARAAADPAAAPIIARMTLVEGDSIAALYALANDPAAPRPDVVYLDPMFPERTKSAAVKKKFQLLHLLERPCADEEALLRAAMTAHPRKIVIKRPSKGADLADAKPSYRITGKAVRYDVIALP